MNASQKKGPKHQWSIAFIIALLIASVLPQHTFAAEASAIKQQWAETKALYQEPTDSTDDWSSIHRLLAGLAVDDAYVQDVQTKITEGTLSKKPTSVALTIVGLSASGIDAEQVAGVHYVNQLLSMEKTSLAAGANEAAWTLLALDSGAYPADGAVTRDWLISTLLEMQQTDGTWPGFQPDMTTMAMTALAPYNTDENPDVQKAITEAANAFEGTIPDNSNSIAQLIIALSANGIDANAAPFVNNNGTSLVDALLTYALEDGSFYWNATQTESNAFATKDAFHALHAYVTYQSEGKGQIYNDLLQKRNALDSHETEDKNNTDSTSPDAANEVDIHLTVSTHAELVVLGNATAETPLQGLTDVLDQNDIPYNVEDTSFGPYLSEIAGLEAGTLDANAGWQYAITRDNKTFLPGEAVNAPGLLEDGDVLHFFYGGFGIGPASDSSAAFIGPSTLAVAVEKTMTTYDSSFKATVTKVPASNVTISLLDGTSATTNDHGIAVLNNVTAESQFIQIFDFQEDALPSIVPSTLPLEIDSNVPDALWVDSYAETAVKSAIENNWMHVQEDTGAFLPDTALTRAEAIRLLSNHLPLKDVHETIQFADVKTSAPYAESIYAAQHAGWIKGEEDGRFYPHEEVTRQELSLMLARALELPASEAGSVFNDEAAIWPQARPAVNALHAAGILKGTGTRFNPDDYVTREMTAVILERLLAFQASKQANAS